MRVIGLGCAQYSFSANLCFELVRRRATQAYTSMSTAKSRDRALSVVKDVCDAFCSAQPGGAPQSCTQVVPFGSSGLGVAGEHSDLDVVALFPRHVSRAAIFGNLPAIFRTVEGVDSVVSVPRAFVPVIKMRVYGVEVDILVATLSLPTLLNVEIDSPHTFTAAQNDTKGVLSLNGVRVCHFLKQATHSCPTFLPLLRLVKAWARVRGLYGTSAQFLGGVSWAIMVAKVVTGRPHDSLLAHAQQFFALYAQWAWPAPVMLAEQETSFAGAPSGSIGRLKPWSQVMSPHEVMPIITPCFPSMNSAHSVTMHTRAVLVQEMARVADVLTAACMPSPSGSRIPRVDQLGHAMLNGPHPLQQYHVLLTLHWSTSVSKAQEAKLLARMPALAKSLQQLPHPSISCSARVWSGAVRPAAEAAGDLACGVGNAALVLLLERRSGGEAGRVSFPIGACLRAFAASVQGGGGASLRVRVLKLHKQPPAVWTLPVMSAVAAAASKRGGGTAT